MQQSCLMHQWHSDLRVIASTAHNKKAWLVVLKVFIVSSLHCNMVVYCRCYKLLEGLVLAVVWAADGPCTDGNRSFYLLFLAFR